MKIAVTAQGPGPDAEVDPRFGRARYFVVIDSETGQRSVQDNAANLNATQGAGIQAARAVVDLGVQAVITGHVGPKAFAALQAAGVTIYTGACGKVTDAMAQFRANELKPAACADVEGHWT